MSLVRVRADPSARTRPGMRSEPHAFARYADPVAAARNSGASPVEAGRDVERLFPPHQPYPPEPDPVDEASEESFPASDSPSTWSREEN
ncbi:MAG: hypothetical protein QOE87_1072 [Gaiellales bacterium]|nr:hypothetical protein [Gaiellales bacterium]